MTKTKKAIIVVRYLLVTGVLFLGIDHFMGKDQGWVALGIAALWFMWTNITVSSSRDTPVAGDNALDSGYSSDASTSWKYSEDFD